MHHIKGLYRVLKSTKDHQSGDVDVSNDNSNNIGKTTPSNSHVSNPANQEILKITQQAIDVFLASAQPNGEIGGLGYWQTANGYTAIALHDLWSNNKQNEQYLCQALKNVAKHHKDLINEFNDDTLWWAHCLLDAHPLTGEEWYMNTVVKIQQHVSASVIPNGKYEVNGNDMGGAVMWTTRPGEDQVNSITTGLYAELCARLSLLVPESPRRKHWLASGEHSMKWILRCRYRAHEALVLDTIKLKTKECVDWTFTYTTAQALSACVALYEALNRCGQDYQSQKSAGEYLDLACEMASKSMRRPGWVEDDGVLTEHGAYGKGNHEPWQNDDAVGFKSVLVRALAKLFRVLGHEHQQVRSEIKAFIEKQFSTLREKDTNGRGQYGPWWNGPMELPTSHSQMAVLDVMAAIHLVGA